MHKMHKVCFLYLRRMHVHTSGARRERSIDYNDDLALS